MTIERLPFETGADYCPVEAAIHAARYAIARPHVVGRRVLDISCGEGYGALMMKRWGAASVAGVDISDEAISVARRRFQADGIAFSVHDAHSVDELFPAHSFDVIVSLETIEHLTDPVRFLRALRKVAVPGAVIIISCPNDHWYYPEKDQGNVFHIRKYSFEEFCAMATKVLGKEASWAFGGPVNGFGTISSAAMGQLDASGGQIAMMAAQTGDPVMILPNSENARLTIATCSHFVGVWGADIGTSAAIYLASMDEFLPPDRIAGLWQAYKRLVEVEGTIASYMQQITILERDQLERERITLDYAARIAELEDDLAKNEAVAAGYATQISSLEQVVAHRDETIADVTLDRSRLDWRVKAFEAQEEIVGQRLRDMATNLEVLRSECAQQQTEIEAKRSRIHELDGVIDRYAAQIRDLEPVVAKRATAYQGLEAKCGRLESRVKAFETQEEIVGQRMRDLAANLEVLRSESAQQKAEIEAKRGRIEELERIVASCTLQIHVHEANFAERSVAFEELSARTSQQILDLQALAEERGMALHDLGLQRNQLEERVKAFQAEEDIASIRFHELKGRLQSAEAVLSERDQLIHVLHDRLQTAQAALSERDQLIARYEPIVSDYNRILPVVRRARRLWAIIPVPVRRLIIGLGRRVMR